MRRRTFVWCGVATGLLAAMPHAVHADGTEAAIKVIADITAIQVTCRNLDVRPGVAFQYIESKGVRTVDVLPGGRRRADFEAAFAKASMIDRSELCSSIASKYAADLPGVIGER